MDDLANAIFFFMKKKIKEDYINIGSGKEFSITWYAKFIMKMLNINLKINKNKTMPDGVKSKLMNSSLALKHGWRPKIDLVNGFRDTFQKFRETI